MESEEATGTTPELHRSLADLIRQLSDTAAPPTEDQLREIVASPATVLLVARLDGQVVGTLSALTRAALDRARDLGARTVELTSRPSRTAANAMYQQLGFRLRDTNVYRYDFSA